MNRCLKDKTLLLLQGKEGNSAQRAHLTQCEACAARYEDLRRDLMAISQVLRKKATGTGDGSSFAPAHYPLGTCNPGDGFGSNALLARYADVDLVPAPSAHRNCGRGSLEFSVWISVKFILTQRSDGGGSGPLRRMSLTNWRLRFWRQTDRANGTICRYWGEWNPELKSQSLPSA